MTLEHESDSKDKGEVNDQNRTIDQFQPNRLHPLSILSVKSPIVSLNLGGLVDEKKIKGVVSRNFFHPADASNTKAKEAPVTRVVKPC
jgi:hypothetical protein